MNGNDIISLGFGPGPVVGIALSAANLSSERGRRDKDIKLTLSALKEKPKDFLHDEIFGELAQALAKQTVDDEKLKKMLEDTKPKPFKIWGEEGIGNNAIEQMHTAMQLPFAVKGALMADSHLGYGLPIGGVIACDNVVVPNFVGVDIACRVKLTILDMPAKELAGMKDKFKNALLRETKFGKGVEFTRSGRHNHGVMDDPLWDKIELLRNGKNKAHNQLGTSGSGNHFVDIGTIKVFDEELGEGEYVAILSHSGSRGIGHKVASHYHKLAISLMPKQFNHIAAFRNLAWLSLDTDEGQEYWEAMNLMGRYASANHALIHESIIRNIGVNAMSTVENHHNYSWLEEHDGKDYIVHRKGATPAAIGEVGVIPGTMADSCFVVRGKGNAESLCSSSHGAGRQMSRTDAKNSFTWSEWKRVLEEKGIELISAGLDEVPGAYKDIHEVMAAQVDLVDPIAEFSPKIVRMADDGTAED